MSGSLTFAQARDEMIAQVNTPWKLANPTLPLLFDDRKGDKPTRGAWARVSIRHNRGEQETLAGPIGNRMFFRDGLITVEVYTPQGDGLSKADELAKICADAFEGKSTPNGVWFRRVRIREIGPDQAWYQVNVIAEFTYSEVK